MDVSSASALSYATPTGHLSFVSDHAAVNVAAPDPRMAYGGMVMGFGIHCAYGTVSAPFRIYSCTGSFTSTTTTGIKLDGQVTEVRNTRSFATRRVDITQVVDTSEVRLVMTMLVDFQLPEKESLLNYDLPPSVPFSNVGSSWTMEQMYEAALARNVSPRIIEAHRKRFAIPGHYFDRRVCPESLSTQRLFGMDPKAKTAQEDLHITERRASNWWRSLEPLTAPVDHAASIAFVMDAGTATVPPAFAGIDLREVGALASLDFALRFFANDIAFDRWHSREEKTLCAREGRTFQDVHIRDEHGRSVAHMTQQCILRPRKRTQERL